MIRRFLTLLLTLPLLFAPAALAAPGIAADVLVKGVTDEVLAILRQDKALQSGDRHKAVRLIDEKIAPHFDFHRMTSLAVGPTWRQTSFEQREALAREFRTLLVRTYANALTAYRDQTVSFKPTTGPREAGDVTVRSQINQPGATPIALDYRLSRNGDSWKVFDVAVDNVSLVTSYRGNFAAELGKGGPDGLIAALREQNRRFENPPRSGDGRS
ncbi:hypothetical protein CJ010_03715 [Azoarcus sp. DD4]|uniref:MlaC/ttg2D family ABC transporter substrate-binding protein n=1 Tax=Azoarcus sp. DD4 TaxID=2027405 RepID=UPI00112707E6|nr:ABC transporter substrate-binding protein [Azoarcus sp. DD4]QDF95722.1 hypothetical protein CJ010_03715 [Azoarcus sp. DD4]